ncbi:uncharacterized protein G6M90_00g064700 [Metarhizium brunneum]|uniref:Uncharacterized protein n=1 Tax=Metarhizium brunneum TaxID=500148 RepID=A0A7D5Z257_9HYPO|nr:hypothetical protein G6M90_00g064700 [Metarhizium brunneum]
MRVRSPAKTANGIRNTDFTGTESCADDLGLVTHSANLMLHLTKYAKIYAAKVATNGFSSEELAWPVCMALKICIDLWDVDLTVLPFGFAQPVSDIHLGIRRAHAKRKLIMAAAEVDSELDRTPLHLCTVAYCGKSITVS